LRIVSKPSRPARWAKPGHECIDLLPGVEQVGAAAEILEFLAKGNDFPPQALHIPECLLLDG